MLEISSESNKLIKKVKQLQQKKYRSQYGQIVIEGFRFCQEAILRGIAIEGILVSEEFLAKEQLPAQWDSYPLYIVKNGLLEKALHTVNPQGVAAIVAQPQWEWAKVAEMKKLVILDGVQDPGNIGTILRTALAASVDGVICLKGTVDCYNDKTLRSTMGAIFSLPIYVCDDIDWLKEELANWGFQIIVAEVSATNYHYEYQYPEKTALVLGNEANGPIHIKEGNIQIKIPMHPAAESLNVAIAGGIIMYEIVRQKAMSSK